MPRSLDTVTLDGAAEYYAAQFLLPSIPHPVTGGRFVGGRSYVVQDLFALTFRDEFEAVRAGVMERLGGRALAEFEALAKEHFAPREDRVFAALLRDKLAIDADGNHIAGAIGTTQIGARLVGRGTVEVEELASIRHRKRHGVGKDDGRLMTAKTVPLYWPIYAGEGEERAAGSGVADPLPPGTPGLPLGATNTRISNEAAIAAADAVVDLLDEGTGAAVIQLRTGAQPADPDTAVTGTLLGTLVCSDPAFGNAADANPGGRATASAITDDSSADATGTAGYFRASATNDGATPLDDHIDGEVGTSGADMNLNTVSIVSGATLSITSWTVTMPES